MKQLKSSVTTAFVLLALGSLHAYAAPASPGRIDFGAFTAPASGAEYVEINVGGTLINMASQLIAKHEPEVAKLIGELRSIRVNVVGIDDENREELQQRALTLGEQLFDKGWEKVVTVKKQDQDVGIYLKSQDKEVVQGLTVVVFEGNKNAVFINIDGNIRPEQLSLIGERLHLEELKKAGELGGGKRQAKAKSKKDQ